MLLSAQNSFIQQLFYDFKYSINIAKSCHLRLRLQLTVGKTIYETSHNCDVLLLGWHFFSVWSSMSTTFSFCLFINTLFPLQFNPFSWFLLKFDKLQPAFHGSSLTTNFHRRHILKLLFYKFCIMWSSRACSSQNVLLNSTAILHEYPDVFCLDNRDLCGFI